MPAHVVMGYNPELKEKRRPASREKTRTSRRRGEHAQAHRNHKRLAQNRPPLGAKYLLIKMGWLPPTRGLRHRYAMALAR